VEQRACGVVAVKCDVGISVWLSLGMRLDVKNVWRADKLGDAASCRVSVGIELECRENVIIEWRNAVGISPGHGSAISASEGNVFK